MQLKARLVIDKKYFGKNIHIAFLHGAKLYLYEHDGLVGHLEENKLIGADSVTWHQHGRRTWPTPPGWAIAYLSGFEIPL